MVQSQTASSALYTCISMFAYVHYRGLVSSYFFFFNMLQLTSLAWDVYDDQTSKLQSGKSPSSRLTLPERESESNRLHFGAEFLAYVVRRVVLGEIVR